MNETQVIIKLETATFSLLNMLTDYTFFPNTMTGSGGSMFNTYMICT